MQSRIERGKGMNSQEFQAWLAERFNPSIEVRFQTLGGQSYFHVHYDSHIRIMSIRRSTGKTGSLRDDQIRKVLERYKTAPPSARHMTSFYTDTYWRETPDRILAPYVAAVVKAWVEEA